MNRRMMMAVKTGGHAPRLPSEYQEVEWIRPTSDNRILLGHISFNGNAIFRCRYYKENQASSEQALVMATTATGSTMFEVGFSSTRNRLFAYSFGGTSAQIIDPLVNQNWVDLEAVYSTTEPTKKLTLTANGTTKTANGSGANKTGTNFPVALFNGPSGLGLTCYARLAYMQIILNGIETFNLIPCYRKSDGKISVYDIVTETFFTPYDWDELSKGADVN